MREHVFPCSADLQEIPLERLDTDIAALAAELAQRLEHWLMLVAEFDRRGAARDWGSAARPMARVALRAERASGPGSRARRAWSDRASAEARGSRVWRALVLEDPSLSGWSHGGATDRDNLVLLCRFHHRLVHEDGFTIHSGAPGQFRFREAPH